MGPHLLHLPCASHGSLSSAGLARQRNSLWDLGTPIMPPFTHSWAFVPTEFILERRPRSVLHCLLGDNGSSTPGRGLCGTATRKCGEVSLGRVWIKSRECVCGISLQSQHSGDRGRRISVSSWLVCLVYSTSSRPSKTTLFDLASK